MLFRVAVTFETPAHTQRLGVVDNGHFVDLAVAFHTTHPTIHMNRMVEVRVVWNLVELDPLDGLPSVVFVVLIHRLTERLQLRGI
jgi:hypothetical protein